MFNLGLPLIKLVLGFANNSSSSHSIIFLKKDSKYNDCDVDQGEFGWDFFTAASKESKAIYIGLCAMYSIPNSWENNYEEYKQRQKNNEEYVCNLLGIEIPEEGYVDHQSIIKFPLNFKETSINEEFLLDFISFIQHPRILILGGNDNGDGHHPALYKGRSIFIDKTFNLQEESRDILKAKKDEECWTVFNKTKGNSMTFSFEDIIRKLEV